MSGDTGEVSEQPLPERGDAESDQAWGDEPDDNEEQLEADRPPHYDQ